MALVRVKPTDADVAIADAIAGRTTRDRTRCGSADVGRRRACTLRPRFRLVARHDLATLKFGVQATRPSHHPGRIRVAARAQEGFRPAAARPVNGTRTSSRIPLSGKRLDAFPSGHAVHIGALASAATVLPPAQRNIAWVIGCGLVLGASSSSPIGRATLSLASPSGRLQNDYSGC